LRDPREFFDALRRAGIAHPPVRFTPPDSPGGWLSKDGDGFGGRQVGRGGPARTGGAVYWQRERSGVPMSATFVANGAEAVILGFNRQLVRPQGDRPFVFSGVIGPVAVADAVRLQIVAALRDLTAAFSIRGLGSIDFLLRGDAAEVLEINPRPPASLDLYDRIGAGGPLLAHLRACLDGELPPPTHDADGGSPPLPIRGSEIVFARTPLRLDPRGADLLATWPGIHDLPRPGAHFETHDPLCSISAEGQDPAMLRTELAQRRDALLQSLESLND
jgi:predicted ATP-grasp superfamily ATP-dependent carboligase